MQRNANMLLFLIWPIAAVGLTLFFHINAFFSAIVFYGIPALILSIQKTSVVKKALFVSLFSIPLIIIVDYIAELTQTWLWPIPTSIVPYKLFGLVSAEIIVWIFLHVYVVILFYQYFFEKTLSKKFWNKRIEEATLGTLGIFVIFLFVLFLFPTVLHIPYWYAIFGLAGILPVIILEDLRYPTIFPKLLKTAVYFFYLNFTYEIMALKNNWWSFPGKDFIGHVSFFGVKFPFEEFFFWIILFTLSILCYYEYFFNNEGRKSKR